MADLAAPAAADLQVLSIDLLMHVDRAGPGIGVVAGDHVASAVTNQVERFLDRARGSGCFDGDIDAQSAGVRADELEPFRFGHVTDVDRHLRTHCTGQCEAICWRAEGDHARGAGKTCERDRAQPNGARPLHEDRIAQRHSRAIDRMDRGDQSASAADVGFRRNRVGQHGHRHTRLQVDRFGPAAEQPLVRRIGDAIHATRFTARRRSRHRAGAAASAGAVDVEEDDPIPFADRRAVEAGDRSARGVDDAG